SVPQSASRAAIAEMRYDNAAIGDFGRALRQYRGDVFVGKTMKAVTPDTFLIERIGQSEGLLDLRRSAVKGGIEACHLRQFGIEAHRHLDGGEVVRLVQWCQRHQRPQFAD